MMEMEWLTMCETALLISALNLYERTVMCSVETQEVLDKVRYKLIENNCQQSKH